MKERLSLRAINRATLARQLLLERAAIPTLKAVAHLAGIQAQTPHSWYTGLWNRLADFDPEEVSGHLAERRLVRIALMRSTIHLVTPDDALFLRPLIQPVLDRDLFTNFTHGKEVAGLDVAELISVALPILAEKPRTNAELGKLLAEHFPDRAPASLAYAVRNQIPLVQVPPRGLWGRSGPIAHTSTDAWLGRRVDPAASPEEMIRRYLAAFGPATVMDVQTWSGLTRLREVVERLRPELVELTDEDGRELFDLPDAPRPGEDVPAPPRLMYDFDNLLVSHADRDRVITDGYRAQKYAKRRPVPGMVLLEGFTAGDWSLARDRERAVLTIRLYEPRADTGDLAAEAGSLLDFAAADTPPEAREISIETY